MPPVTPAEKLEAEQSLRSSGKKQRISQPAVATEVARRRILRGDYGELTPNNNHIKAAGDDLSLSDRQRKELRKQLLEAMPVRTLDNWFATTDATRLDATPLPPPIQSLQVYAERMAARRAEMDVARPPTFNWSFQEWIRRRADEEIEQIYREQGASAFFAEKAEQAIQDEAWYDGIERCGSCHEALVPMWLEYDGFWCNDCGETLCKHQLYLSCDKCDYDLCHESSLWHNIQWSVRGNAPARGLAQQQRREQEEQERCERERCEREQWEREQRVCVEVDVVSGSRAVLLDFYAGGSPQARQAAQIMRDTGVSCRTLFASCQQTDSCGYNGSTWACMLWALGPERFYDITREQASMVLQPSFIAEQNVKLGYGHSTVARWLGSRRIMELATLDNPDGAGVDPWWLSCPAYDHFLEAFQSTISDADHFRRGGLEIMVVNTGCAGSRGSHL